MHTKSSKGIVAQKKSNEWVLETAGMERGLRNIIKRRKLSYFGHVMRNVGDCLDKKSCKALHREQENKGNQECDGWTTWKNGPKCGLKTYIEEDERQKKVK